MCNFVVGQKVVCVDDSPYDGVWYEGEAPKKGNVYTVRSVHFDLNGNVVIWLNEISRHEDSRKYHGDLVGYKFSRFRPVLTKKTDISIFKEMLHKHKADA